MNKQSGDEIGNTILLSAVEGGDMDIVRFLEKNGASKSATNKIGQNALHVAAINNKLAAVNYYVNEIKLDINSKDRDGNTPLILAIMNR